MRFQPSAHLAYHVHRCGRRIPSIIIIIIIIHNYNTLTSTNYGPTQSSEQIIFLCFVNRYLSLCSPFSWILYLISCKQIILVLLYDVQISVSILKLSKYFTQMDAGVFILSWYAAM